MTEIRDARERLAQAMGNVLRKALDEHLAEHACEEYAWPQTIKGPYGCAEVERLWELQPEGDRIGIAI